MSRKPRLTLLIDSLAPGGAQTQILRLAEGLRASWQVRLAWYNQHAHFFDVPAGVEAVPLPRRARWDVDFARGLRRLVSRAETDLVHAWLPAPSLYATVAGRWPGSAPILAGVRSAPEPLERERFQGHATTVAAHLAVAVTSNSQASLDWLAARGVPRRRMHYIGNALAPAIAARQPSSLQEQQRLLASLGLDPSERPIVSLGRFDAYKNQDGLVRALARVQAQGIYAQGVQVPPLLLAGFLEDQQRVAQVRKLAEESSLRVHIVPAVQDVPTLLEAARFSVLASHTEGTPNVVLEAMGLGQLCVATRVGEVPTLIRDGETGLTCQASDDAALAEVLQRALGLPASQAADIGAAARADILRRFSAPAVVGQYDTLYRAMLDASTAATAGGDL